MSDNALNQHTIGWIGTGKMGFPMARHLIDAGCDLMVWNRTGTKAEPLGVPVAASPVALAERDIVFTMVTDDAALYDATLGEGGLLTGAALPQIVVDASTVSVAGSQVVRDAAEAKGVAFVSAMVSGNGHSVAAKKATMGASGPHDAYATVEPYFRAMMRDVGYVGEGELVRVAKVAHTVIIAVLTQCLAEITILAEKGGVERHAFLDLINKSVLGSIFTQYKTPALVKLDWTATQTSKMLRKDLDLALALSRELEVPMPLTNLAHDILQSLIGRGYGEQDFAALIGMQAADSGLDIAPEDVAVTDGLRDAAE